MLMFRDFHILNERVSYSYFKRFEKRQKVVVSLLYNVESALLECRNTDKSRKNSLSKCCFSFLFRVVNFEGKLLKFTATLRALD